MTGTAAGGFAIAGITHWEIIGLGKLHGTVVGACGKIVAGVPETEGGKQQIGYYQHHRYDFHIAQRPFLSARGPNVSNPSVMRFVL